jgi:hypothetical protein
VEARFSAPVQTGPGAYPASGTMSSGSFTGVKRPGRDADHPLLCSAKVKERVQLCLHSPSGPSWPVNRVNFTFTTYVCHLVLFVHLRPSNQPAVTGVALCNKKVGDSWYNKVVLMVK